MTSSPWVEALNWLILIEPVAAPDKVNVGFTKSEPIKPTLPVPPKINPFAVLY